MAMKRDKRRTKQNSKRTSVVYTPCMSHRLKPIILSSLEKIESLKVLKNDIEIEKTTAYDTGNTDSEALLEQVIPFHCFSPCAL